MESVLLVIHILIALALIGVVLLQRSEGGGLGIGGGGGAGGVLGGYTKTPEGKVVVGAMTDAFNNLVKAVRNYKAQESSGPMGHGSGGRLEVK